MIPNVDDGEIGVAPSINVPNCMGCSYPLKELIYKACLKPCFQFPRLGRVKIQAVKQHEELNTKKKIHVPGDTRARMPVTRVCVHHVDNASAGKSHALTGEIFAHMLFECVCHQVSIVGGDANKLAYQKSGTQLNSSYSMSTCQLWTDRMQQTLDYSLKKVLETNKDMNVRVFHSISYLDLKYFRDTLEGKVDIDPDLFIPLLEVT